MEYMEYWDTKPGDSFEGEKGLFLKTESGSNRVLGIIFQDDGRIAFCEGCDQWFAVVFTKQQAIDALQEAIDYIKNGQAST